jgi:hypothetical protein
MRTNIEIITFTLSNFVMSFNFIFFYKNDLISCLKMRTSHAEPPYQTKRSFSLANNKNCTPAVTPDCGAISPADRTVSFSFRIILCT